jgi:antitoxin (DNA-binding transcriptional repressor) of toxin-antitoxin stability system
MQTITVTDAVRNFSELLNDIRYRGERYTILKGGKPTATMGPVTASARERKLSEMKDIVNRLPRLEDDGEIFARDIARSIAAQPSLGEAHPWE